MIKDKNTNMSTKKYIFGTKKYTIVYLLNLIYLIYLQKLYVLLNLYHTKI